MALVSIDRWRSIQRSEDRTPWLFERPEFERSQKFLELPTTQAWVSVSLHSKLGFVCFTAGNEKVRFNALLVDRRAIRQKIHGGRKPKAPRR